MFQLKASKKSPIPAPAWPKRGTIASQQKLPRIERFRCLEGAIAEQAQLRSGKPMVDIVLPPF